MHKIIFLLLILFISYPVYSEGFPVEREGSSLVEDSLSAEISMNATEELYQALSLDTLVDYSVFEKAMIGYQKIDNITNKDVITLIDFSKPSTEERLFVIDLKEKRILFSTHVAHGKRSGNNYATSFSNKIRSNQSSLGFFVTGNTYRGRRGYSLTMEGMEKGINDNVRARGVVFHGAKYANPETISWGGRLGRSQGCPALPTKLARPIIDTIKGGTMVFIYADYDNYISKSSILASEN